MATTTKKADTFDSKSLESPSAPVYTEITIVVESKPVNQYVGAKSAYKKAPTGAKYWGERLDEYLADFSYDEIGARYRITAKTLTEDEFEGSYKA